MPLAVDLLHPTLREEKRKCKLKRLVPSPNSYFMDVKCPVVFSHVQTAVICPGCDRILCQPTGGKTRLANVIGRRRVEVPASNLGYLPVYKCEPGNKD